MLIKRIINNSIFAKNNSSTPYGQRNNWHQQNRPVIWTVIYITLCWKSVIFSDHVRGTDQWWSAIAFSLSLCIWQALYSEETHLSTSCISCVVLQEHSIQQIHSTHQISPKPPILLISLILLDWSLRVDITNEHALYNCSLQLCICHSVPFKSHVYVPSLKME